MNDFAPDLGEPSFNGYSEILHALKAGVSAYEERYIPTASFSMLRAATPLEEIQSQTYFTTVPEVYSPIVVREPTIDLTEKEEAALWQVLKSSVRTIGRGRLIAK